MKYKILTLIFFILCVSIIIYSQKSESPKLNQIPFEYYAKDFGKIESKTEKKITSEDQSVKDKFPIDLPTHTCFYLEDKRPLPAFEKGARYFFPARSFICFIPTSDPSEKDFAAAYPNFSQSVVKLKNLLKNQPKDFRQFDDLFDVPYNNAGWSFKSKIQYLNYKNISGVFFLTQYSQDLYPSPVNNEELTANFQGLTKNEKFYVAARFAVTHPTLPRGIDFTDEKIRDKALAANSIEEVNKEVGKYLKTEAEKTEKLSDETFRPSLPNLKKLIASIETK